MLRPVRAHVVLLAVIVLMSGFAGLGAASAGTSSPACGPAGARTIASDSVARVYARRGEVFGCARTGRRSYRLGTAAHSLSEGRAGPIALAGVQVAYGLTSYGVDTVSAEVVVRRLTNGHVERRHAAITQPVGAEFFETVDDVVVKTDGSVAWIAHATWIGSGGKGVVEVNKSDRTSGSLLDRSASIDRRSLRLHGSRLSWKDGTRRRSGRLD